MAALAAALAAACAPAALAAGPKVTWMPARTSNYTPANRPVTSIRWIVIHVTEGGFWGSVSWLRNPRARASAHYVVSQEGQIVQLVRDSDIAWHAGNYTINRSSIGIEHEGYTYRSGTLTEAEYRSSAQLSAWIARRSLMPIDRKHFIGHGEVPDPNNPRARGGFSHHTDPGPHWKWPQYMSYVRSYARGAAPPKYTGPKPVEKKELPVRKEIIRAKPVTRQTPGALKVSSLGFESGQTVSGYVRWIAAAAGQKVQRVDFLVDGRLRWSEKTGPFVFGGDSARWDTTRETNGMHVLTVRVVAEGGKVAGSSVRVRVVNTPFQIVSQGLANGEIVSGAVHWKATATGGEADRVEFLVDGRLRHTEEDAPFEWEWDTRKEANGPHALTLRGVAEDGRVATTNLGLTIVNEAPPAPRPPPFKIVSQTLRDGETVRGAVKWEVAIQGDGVASVEFWIDGTKRWSESGRPYVFNGDSGRWDTAQETPGAHQLAVRALHKDGRVDSAAATVTVGAQSQGQTDTSHGKERAALRVMTASLNPGETVSGSARWAAVTEGDDVDRVEFFVDGKLRHTQRRAPYEFAWDTRLDQNGSHTLSLRVRGRNGERYESPTFAVNVANALEPIGVSLVGLAEGASLRGRIHVEARAEGKVDRVEFLVDGRLRHTERTAPYEFDWDSAREPDGAHTLSVRLVTRDGREASAKAAVVVANAPPPAPAPAAPKVSLVVPAAPLRGRVHVEAKVEGRVDRVEFLVDGRLRHTERTAPYEFEWDTAADADGKHSLVARAVGVGGSVEARSEAIVSNAQLAVTISGVDRGATLSGTAHVEARVDGGAVAKVEFLVDGTVRHTETAAPFEFAWDTTRDKDGVHAVTARAVSVDGRTASSDVTVTVGNASAPEPPAAELSVSLPSFTSPLSGRVHVEATVEGKAAKVEFLVDGAVKHTETAAPYEFDWDTTRDSNGAHEVVARAVAADGAVATARAEISVENVKAAQPAVTLQGVEDGATVTGTLALEALVSGSAFRRVELWIDGRRRAVEREAPYTFTWDTSREQRGAHALLVRAVTTSGRVVTVSLTVIVASP